METFRLHGVIIAKSAAVFNWQFYNFALIPECSNSVKKFAVLGVPRRSKRACSTAEAGLGSLAEIRCLVS